MELGQPHLEDTWWQSTSCGLLHKDYNSSSSSSKSFWSSTDAAICRTSMRENRCPPNHCIWLEHVHEHLINMRMKFVTTATWSLMMTWSIWKRRSDCVKERENNITTSPWEHLNNHVTGSDMLFDASWYRVDSRLVTIDGFGMLVMFY